MGAGVADVAVGFAAGLHSLEGAAASQVGGSYAAGEESAFGFEEWAGAASEMVVEEGVAVPLVHALPLRDSVRIPSQAGHSEPGAYGRD